MPLRVVSGRMHKPDLVLFQACKRPQILVLASVSERMDILVAVMKMGEQDVGS